MSKLYSSIYSCLHKGPTPEQATLIKDNSIDDESDDAMKYPTEADKKTDEPFDPSKEPGILRKVTGGIYNTAAGAVGLGIGGVKWAASKSYSVGQGVVSASQTVVQKVKTKRKTKNE